MPSLTAAAVTAHTVAVLIVVTQKLVVIAMLVIVPVLFKWYSSITCAALVVVHI
jgi:hypothetical protein